jgi:hypothetical protein
MPDTHIASCNCGAIRIEARGEPVRVGLCHCTTCRKGGGALFAANAIWRAEDVTIQGNTRSWKDTTVSRHFCPTCGSSLFGNLGDSGETAIGLGAFDQAPTDMGQPTSCGLGAGRGGSRWRLRRRSFRETGRRRRSSRQANSETPESAQSAHPRGGPGGREDGAVLRGRHENAPPAQWRGLALVRTSVVTGAPSQRQRLPTRGSPDTRRAPAPSRPRHRSAAHSGRDGPQSIRTCSSAAPARRRNRNAGRSWSDLSGMRS